MRGEVANQLNPLEMQKQRPPEHFHVAHTPSYVLDWKAHLKKATFLTLYVARENILHEANIF